MTGIGPRPDFAAKTTEIEDDTEIPSPPTQKAPEPPQDEFVRTSVAESQTPSTPRDFQSFSKQLADKLSDHQLDATQLLTAKTQLETAHNGRGLLARFLDYFRKATPGSYKQLSAEINSRLATHAQVQGWNDKIGNILYANKSDSQKFDSLNNVIGEMKAAKGSGQLSGASGAIIDSAITKAQNRAKDFAPLEEKLLRLGQAAEEIGNTSTNLMDVFSLKPNPGENAEKLADEFIAALKTASGKDPPMSSFTFRGKTVEVDPTNRKPLTKFDLYFKSGEAADWKAALIDYINAQGAKSRGKIHIAEPLLKAMQSMRNQSDANAIGDLLMSEVTQTGGGKRRIDLSRLTTLLNDDRIKSSPLLTRAVLQSAKDVQLRAVRKEQSNRIWDPSSKLDRASKQAWDAQAEALGNSEEHLDFNGIKQIAQKANITSDTITSSPELDTLNQDFSAIKQLIADKLKEQ